MKCKCGFKTDKHFFLKATNFAFLSTAGPLAQSAERGADNAKVVSSTLTRTKENFSFTIHIICAIPSAQTNLLFPFFFNDMVGIYMHKNHLVHKYERRYCFVTFKIGKNDCSVKSAIQIRSRDLNKHQYNTITLF